MGTRHERPTMPGYGIQAASEGVGLLPWSFVGNRMLAARNYWIGSTRPDGAPHAAPVWGLWHEDAFYFSSGAQSVKARNLAADARAVVHLESGDEVVILEGVMDLETDEQLLKVLNVLYQSKYGFDMVGPGVIYRLNTKRALAWREEDFPTSATRWNFD